jgi:lantibiotic modifying enzyme
MVRSGSACRQDCLTRRASHPLPCRTRSARTPSAKFRAGDALADGARTLAGVRGIGPEPLPGLYVGEAGIGAALLRAGLVLHDSAIVDAARERSQWVAELPFGSHDLYNGTAGRLRFHLMLHAATGDPEPLDAARVCVEQLQARADWTSNGACSWTYPSGYESLSGEVYLGYAHGAAGIADSLLDHIEVTGFHESLPLVNGVVRLLQSQAILLPPSPTGELAAAWPASVDGPPTAALWCHGAAGVVQFLSRCVALGHCVDSRGLLDAAAYAVAFHARAAGPTQCHGLAGNIEVLLDVFQATGKAQYLEWTRPLVSLLTRFASTEDARMVWTSDIPGLVTSDYLVGFSGIAALLLRLVEPHTRPRQLSVASFAAMRL